MVKVIVTQHAMKRLMERYGGEDALTRLKEWLEQGTLLLKTKEGTLYVHCFPLHFILERAKGKEQAYFLVTVHKGVPFGLWRKDVQVMSRCSPLRNVKIVFAS